MANHYIEDCPNRKPDRKTLLVIEECDMWKGSRERFVAKAVTVTCKVKGSFALGHRLRLLFRWGAPTFAPTAGVSKLGAIYS